MRIALCQTEIIFENKEVNYIKAGRMIEGAVAQGGELILFPEMSFTGFSMNTAVTKEKKDSSPTLTLMQGYATRYHVAIGFGWTCEPDDENMTRPVCENHYTIIGADGNVLADYVKVHPFSFQGENEFFRGGEELVTFEMNHITFGLAICYDLRFPEMFTTLTKKAEAVIVAANWPAQRGEHWKCLMKARAIENQSYMIGINCVGAQENTLYSGDSMVISPDGKTMISKNGEEILLIADILPTVLEQRLAFPVRSDRKEELYARWNDR